MKKNWRRKHKHCLIVTANRKLTLFIPVAQQTPIMNLYTFEKMDNLSLKVFLSIIQIIVKLNVFKVKIHESKIENTKTFFFSVWNMMGILLLWGDWVNHYFCSLIFRFYVNVFYRVKIITCFNVRYLTLNGAFMHCRHRPQYDLVHMDGPSQNLCLSFNTTRTLQLFKWDCW